MHGRSRLASCLLLLCGLSPAAMAATVHKELVIQHKIIAPDGCVKTAILVNGQTPGPEIRVKQGDDLVVTVHNMLPSEGVTIHWHGIIPINPWQEGSDVSQCPISRGTYTYRFKVNAHPGTYWYHGHASGQRGDGLLGPFIVEPAAPNPSPSPAEKLIAGTDGEFTVMLQDWYHVSSIDQTTGLDAVPFRWIGNPPIILINGKGNGGPDYIAKDLTCKNASADALLTTTPPVHEVFKVQKGKKYYVRIISAATLNYMALRFDSHTLKVVAADGQYVQPYDVEVLPINAGQRYGVILTANQDGRFHWMRVESRYRDGGPNGTAVLQYGQAAEGAAQAWAATAPAIAIPYEIGYDPRKIKGVDKLPADMQKSDVTLLLDGQQALLDKQLRWVINNITFRMPEEGTPLLNYAYQGKMAELDETSSAPLGTYDLDVVIDLVFQNKPALNGRVEQHPWHLHGYDFYVLGYGPGLYNKAKHASLLNLNYPVLRDVVTVYPEGTYWNGTTTVRTNASMPLYEQNAGWSVVRFKTAHPGAWLVHCHIESHLHLGMAALIVVAPDLIPDPRLDMPQCGRTELFKKKRS